MQVLYCECNFKFVRSSSDQIVTIDLQILSKFMCGFVKMQEKGKIWVEA